MPTNNEIIRGFTVKMTFSKSVEEDEFYKIIEEVPKLLNQAGRVLRCLPFKRISKDDGSETILNFTVDLASFPGQARRNVIEDTIAKHYDEAEVLVLVD